VQNTEQTQQYTRHNLAKVDKTNLTKQEAKDLMSARRLEKQTKQSFTRIKHDTKYFVLCLKHGTKYSADYVNILYNMVKRNCTLDYQFACLTDDPTGLNDDIITIPLPEKLAGWWCKPYMFSKDLPIKGTILYLDLDVVISGNIDKLLTYQPGHWCSVRDFTRAMRSNWKRLNSSVVRFDTGQLDFVWQNYKDNTSEIQRKFFGDQDYLWDETKSKLGTLFYPDSWILSWKWEVRRSREWQPGGFRGNRTFKVIEDVKPRAECCVCVFHGDPNPHKCEDPYIVDNWK